MDFGIGGLIRSVANPANLAMLVMGPAGWAGLAGKMLMGAIGQQVIQQIGQQLGLPQSVIDLGKASFAAASGTQGLPTSIRGTVAEIAEQFNLSPRQQGALERAAIQDVRNAVDYFTNDMAEGRSTREAKSSGGKSWLMAIAESLGKNADKLAKEMNAMSDKLGKGNEKSQASDNLKFGAKSQEFSMFFNSANTVLKTLGEALSAGARKQ